MVKVFLERDYGVVSNGTDNPLFLLDLIAKNVTGKDAEAALSHAHITGNKNSVPNDPKWPFVTSGLRLDSPASTTWFQGSQDGAGRRLVSRPRCRPA